MKNSHLFPAIVIIALAGFYSCNSGNDNLHLKSPDKLLVVNIKEENKTIVYDIQMVKNGSKVKVINSSPLGIVREDSNFAGDLKIVNSQIKKNLKEDYQLVTGKKQKCKNHFNELTITLENEDQLNVGIVFRVFNDGVAFSYLFPENDEKHVRVLKETTGFNLPEGKAWVHSYDTVTTWSPGYETFYEGPMPIGTKAPANKNGWAFPALFETNDNIWVLISESGFDGNYIASHIDVDEKGTYFLRNPEPEESMGFYENTSFSKLPFRSPWRIIMASANLNALVNSTLVTDLADECIIEDISWIKPGRASWSWWYDNDSPQDYQLMLPYIDMASEMGWEYFLVDANWNMMKNGSIEDLVKYASSKGVALHLWYNSGGKHNVVTEAPRDLMDDRTIRREEFKRIHEMGIKGIKVDFFQSDKQRIIKQYIELLEDAAEFKLLVNFHGCTLPKGWRRTYPNLVTMEAIRGGECYIFDRNFPSKAPQHLAIAAFSRAVVGPTDYTPGGFANNTYPFETSLAFEVALPIIFESGITHFVDPPDAIKEQPDFVKDFLKNIPVVWDELVFLDGYPGEYQIIARRNGKAWYIAAINGQDMTQKTTIDLSGLTNSDQITMITEGDEGRSLQQKRLKLENGKIEIELKPLGGFVAVL